MCLLIVLSRMDPVAPFVVAANRDERFDRPAMAATVRGSERTEGLRWSGRTRRRDLACSERTWCCGRFDEPTISYWSRPVEAISW